jgi:hypothetical protein
MTATLNDSHRMRALVGIILVLAMLVAVPAAPAEAATGDTFMTCAEGTGEFAFTLSPLNFYPYWVLSQFYYRIDGQSWYSTYWFAKWGVSVYFWDGDTWEPALIGGLGPSLNRLPGRHLVEGGEWRWTAAAGYEWVPLGSCWTVNYADPTTHTIVP